MEILKFPKELPKRIPEELFKKKIQSNCQWNFQRKGRRSLQTKCRKNFQRIYFLRKWHINGLSNFRRKGRKDFLWNFQNIFKRIYCKIFQSNCRTYLQKKILNIEGTHLGTHKRIAKENLDKMAIGIKKNLNKYLMPTKFLSKFPKQFLRE